MDYVKHDGMALNCQFTNNINVAKVIFACDCMQCMAILSVRLSVTFATNTMPAFTSQPKLVLILPTPEGWKAESTCH